MAKLHHLTFQLENMAESIGYLVERNGDRLPVDITPTGWNVYSRQLREAVEG